MFTERLTSLSDSGSVVCMAETFIFKTTCSFCGKTSKLKLNEQAFNDWRNRRKTIREAFPKLSADDRELILTGIDSECWEKNFSDD